jgi:hypothetical protein
MRAGCSTPALHLGTCSKSAQARPREAAPVQWKRAARCAWEGVLGRGQRSPAAAQGRHAEAGAHTPRRHARSASALRRRSLSCALLLQMLAAGVVLRSVCAGCWARRRAHVLSAASAPGRLGMACSLLLHRAAPPGELPRAADGTSTARCSHACKHATDAHSCTLRTRQHRISRLPAPHPSKHRRSRSLLSAQSARTDGASAGRGTAPL